MANNTKPTSAWTEAVDAAFWEIMRDAGVSPERVAEAFMRLASELKSENEALRGQILAMGETERN